MATVTLYAAVNRMCQVFLNHAAMIQVEAARQIEMGKSVEQVESACRSHADVFELEIKALDEGFSQAINKAAGYDSKYDTSSSTLDQYRLIASKDTRSNFMQSNYNSEGIGNYMQSVITGQPVPPNRPKQDLVLTT